MIKLGLHIGDQFWVQYYEESHGHDYDTLDNIYLFLLNTKEKGHCRLKEKDRGREEIIVDII